MRSRLSASAALLAALLVTALLAPLPATAAASTGRNITITPRNDLVAAFKSLRAGDHLVLAPGVYNISNGGQGIRPILSPGTKAHPILVTALDAANPPLLTGNLVMYNADYWTMQYIRIQATLPGQEALVMFGGVGWTLHKDEFFGASATGAYANVAIFDAGATPPQHWAFIDNCVHDAGRGTASGHSNATDHNLYVAAVGNAPGLIARNIMMNASAGANIKIGNGGATVANPHPVGASNVHVEYNTLYNANEHILVFGNLTGIVVANNLDVRAIFPDHPRASVRLDTLNRPRGVTVGQNYNFTLPSKNPPAVGVYVYAAAASTYLLSAGNQLRPDPGLTSLSCNGYRLANSSVYHTFGRFADHAGSPIVP